MAAPPSEDLPLFAVRALDRENSADLRAQTRVAHLDWAVQPAAAMKFGGPLRASPSAAVQGSLLLMRAASAEALAALLESDPYAKAGLFGGVETRAWVCGMQSDAPLPATLYAVWCVDKADMLETRKVTRPSHLQWWRDAGRKGMIGPFPCEGGACGTLIVCEGESVEEVRAWSKTDPYYLAGMFERVDVGHVTKVIENGQLTI